MLSKALITLVRKLILEYNKKDAFTPVLQRDRLAIKQLQEQRGVYSGRVPWAAAGRRGDQGGEPRPATGHAGVYNIFRGSHTSSS